MGGACLAGENILMKNLVKKHFWRDPSSLTLIKLNLGWVSDCQTIFDLFHVAFESLPDPLTLLINCRKSFLSLLKHFS